MAKQLAGKVALVTGAGRPHGIGRATALKLAEHGADVVVTDIAREREDLIFRSQEMTIGIGDEFKELNKLVSEIGTLGTRGLAVAVDITDRNQIEACIQKTCEAFGGVDILFNNAGTGVGARPILELKTEDWDLSYQVNLKGMADFCQLVIPVMIDGGGGSIINNSSIGGLKADPGYGAYTATKFGVIGLTKTIALEFGEHNIRCNAICPGVVETQMMSPYFKVLASRLGVDEDEARAQIAEVIALKRFAQPEEVAEVVAFLAGPGASYITGVALPVDGGYAAGL